MIVKGLLSEKMSRRGFSLTDRKLCTKDRIAQLIPLYITSAQSPSLRCVFLPDNTTYKFSSLRRCKLEVCKLSGRVGR